MGCCLRSTCLLSVFDINTQAWEILRHQVCYYTNVVRSEPLPFRSFRILREHLLLDRLKLIRTFLSRTNTTFLLVLYGDKPLFIHASIVLMLQFFQEGVMATHDEELKKYFKHSSVTCVLAPRYGSSKLGFIKQQACPTRIFK